MHSRCKCDVMRQVCVIIYMYISVFVVSRVYIYIYMYIYTYIYIYKWMFFPCVNVHRVGLYIYVHERSWAIND